MSRPLFKGVITALVTPFRDGKVDEQAFAALLERQIAAGVHGVVPVGTTGESATVTPEEHKQLISQTVEVSAGRVPVIAGVGGNDTASVIAMARHAKTVGADGVLAVTPYYNRPSQEGMYLHFKALNDAVQIPILLYNVPSRTSVDLANETVERLAKLPNGVGIKDATGDMVRISLMRRVVPSTFSLISGDDPTLLGYMAHGGHGVISVTSNVAPEACVARYNAAAQGAFDTAGQWQDRLVALDKALFLDNSPAPAKYALNKLGLCPAEVRLPLAPTNEAARPRIDEAMLEAGLV